MSKEIENLKKARNGLVVAVVAGLVGVGKVLVSKAPKEGESVDTIVQIGKYIFGKKE